jgi:hypothetical protein
MNRVHYWGECQPFRNNIHAGCFAQKLPRSDTLTPVFWMNAYGLSTISERETASVKSKPIYSLLISPAVANMVIRLHAFRTKLEDFQHPVGFIRWDAEQAEELPVHGSCSRWECFGRPPRQVVGASGHFRLSFEEIPG